MKKQIMLIATLAITINASLLGYFTFAQEEALMERSYYNLEANQPELQGFLRTLFEDGNLISTLKELKNFKIDYHAERSALVTLDGQGLSEEQKTHVEQLVHNLHEILSGYGLTVIPGNSNLVFTSETDGHPLKGWIIKIPKYRWKSVYQCISGVVRANDVEDVYAIVEAQQESESPAVRVPHYFYLINDKCDRLPDQRPSQLTDAEGCRIATVMEKISAEKIDPRSADIWKTLPQRVEIGDPLAVGIMKVIKEVVNRGYFWNPHVQNCFFGRDGKLMLVDFEQPGNDPKAIYTLARDEAFPGLEEAVHGHKQDSVKAGKEGFAQLMNIETPILETLFAIV
ncbi:hypothetical protein KAW80_01350 [Candidatus Babeliales bacterium]|nr:hypothetical protein [Candidatus Babeliales bacterium]